MLRRLHHDQPASFAFTHANRAWAEAQITKYPPGRQASAIIPLLWRAQEQEGWLTRPAIEYVADMLGMAHIRALEVATFYFMFQLQPVGSVAHVQVCGTLSCMLCGAEDLIAVCKDRISPRPHDRSADGRFSWEEVECLGSCANAPMAQIGKDYYEDLTAEKLRALLDEFAAGRVPVPGPQNGRYAAEPLKGLTSLTEYESGRTRYNASVQLAVDKGDTVARIDGTSEPLLTPWRHDAAGLGQAPRVPATPKARASAKTTRTAAPATPAKPARPGKTAVPGTQTEGRSDTGPVTLSAPRGGRADDLKLIVGVGPKLEALLHELGFWHFDQIAAWTPAEVAWVDSRLGTFRGRIGRDDWIAQARRLAGR